jgi:hypothetical protein
VVQTGQVLCGALQLATHVLSDCGLKLGHSLLEAGGHSFSGSNIAIPWIEATAIIYGSFIFYFFK